MNVSDNIGSFRTNPVDRDTACQSSMKADVNENTVLETIQFHKDRFPINRSTIERVRPNLIIQKQLKQSNIT